LADVDVEGVDEVAANRREENPEERVERYVAILCFLAVSSILN